MEFPEISHFIAAKRDEFILVHNSYSFSTFWLCAHQICSNFPLSVQMSNNEMVALSSKMLSKGYYLKKHKV